MSDAPLTPPTNPTKSDPATPPASGKPKRKKWNWRRRVIAVLLTVVALAVLLRVAIAVAFPRVLRSVADAYGLDASYERVELNFLAGDLGIWHLNLAPKSGGGESVIHADFARADISPLNLLRGRLVAYRVEADGINLTVERDKQGNVPLFDRFLAQQARNADAGPKPGADAALRPQDVDLTAPLRIDALRVQYVKARLKDEFVTPPVDTTLELNVRVSDVDSDVRPVRYQIDVASPPLLDALRIEGTAKAKGKDLDANMTFTLRGLHPKPAAGYLRPLGIEPRAERIDVSASGTLMTHGAKLDPSHDALAGTLAMRDLTVTADDAEAVGVDALTLDAAAIADGLIDLAKLSIDGVRANASRTPAGNVAVAGLELVPPTPTTPATRPAGPAPAVAAAGVAAAASTSEPQARAVAAATAEAVAATRPFAALPFKAKLGEFALSDVKLAFADAGVAPRADLAFVVRSLVAKNLVADPADPDAAVDIQGTFAAPGIAERISLAGSAKPFATAAKTAELAVTVDGIRPEAIRPYLAAAGVESQYAGGTLTADVSATLRPAPGAAAWTADASLGRVVLRDGADLLALDGVKITGARFLPDGTLRIDAVEGKGPAVSARRDKQGRVVALGFRTGAAAPAPAAPAAAPSPAAPPSPSTAPSTQAAAAEPGSSPLPKLEIGKLSWSGVRARLGDDMTTPAAAFDLEDLSVEITDFRTTPDPTGAAKPGKVLVSLRAPQLAKKLAVTGTIDPKPDGVSFDLAVDGQGIRTADIAPYLAGSGVEPTLKDATLKLGAKVDLKTDDPARLIASLAVSGFTYADEGKELVGVDALRVTGVELASGGLTVDAVELEKPRAAAARDADGALRVAGVRIPPPAAPAEAGKESTAAAPAPVAPTPAAPPPPPPVANAPPVPAAPPAFVTSVKKISVAGGSLAWSDRAVSPAVEQVGAADVTLTGLTLGDPNAAPARLTLTASAAPSLDRATVDGTVSLLPASQAASLEITAAGLREGVLAPYLPPGLRVALKDGRFRTKIEAGVGEHPKGGQRASLVVTALDYRDADAAEALLALEAFSVKVERIDLPGRVVAIDEIVLSGLETGAERDATGTLKALGLLVGAPVDAAKQGQAPPAPLPSAQTPPRAEAPAATQPAATQPAATQPAATDVATLVAAGRQPMPLVTLNKLDVGIKRASFAGGATADGAKPLVLSDLRVRNKQPIELLGDENAPRPPAEIEATFAVLPLAGEVRANVKLAPDGPRTDVHVDVAASGVRGEGVTEAFPALKSSLEGSGMTDGRFTAAVDAAVKMQQRALVAMDFGKGIELDLLVKGVAFRAEPDGRVLVGVDEVRSEGIKFDPQTGNLHAKSVDVTTPVAHAFNDKDGLHVLGLVLKPAPAATQPSAPTPAEPSTAPAVAQAAPAEPAAPASEIRVDRLTISGLDASYEDRTTDPHTLVPLNGLDVEVRGFTTRALTEEIPVTFSATVSAGKVPLPHRQTTGLAAGVMSMIGAGPKKPSGGAAAAETDPATGLEPRELFAQLTADGRVALFPQPKGWVKTSLSGFEATGVRGFAKGAGIEIGNGTVDNTIDARLPGDGSAVIKTRTVFTDLRMTEQPNGPVQSLFKLPGPLDFVIGAVEDPSGGITFPITVPVKQGELNTGAVVGSAIGATAGVIATGVASSPFKAAQGATDVVAGVANVAGLGRFLPWGKKAEQPEGPVEITFTAGDASVGFAAQDELRVVAERLRKDKSLVVTLKHRMAAADVTAAAGRANPSPADAEAFAYQLRGRKLELAARRAALAGRARAELASLPPAAVAETVEQLRAIDRESAETEDALDGVYDLLRPGADRAAPRRTRAAAIAIGNARLDSVRAALVVAGVPDAANRVRITSAKFEPDAELAEGGGHVVMTTAKAAK